MNQRSSDWGRGRGERWGWGRGDVGLSIKNKASFVFESGDGQLRAVADVVHVNMQGSREHVCACSREPLHGGHHLVGPVTSK